MAGVVSPILYIPKYSAPLGTNLDTSNAALKIPLIAGNAPQACDAASHPARYRLDVRPYPSATANGPFPSASELDQ